MPSVRPFLPVLRMVVVRADGFVTGHPFSHGTNAHLNEHTVAFVYDHQAGAGPTVRLANCRPL